MSDCSLPPLHGLAPTHRRYGVVVHSVEVHWRLHNSALLTIGPEPRLVLAARARRDVELLCLRVDFPELLRDPGMAGVVAETLVVMVPHVVGLRRLKPEGEPLVWGQEDVDARPMLAGQPEDAAAAPEQVRWYGGTVDVVEHNCNVAPNDYWCWRGRVAIPKGQSVGLIVRCQRPTSCKVMLAGI